MARYDAIVPGAAERIIQMAEGEAAHVRRMDELAVKGQFGDQRVGQIFGLLVVFGAFVLAAYVASLRPPRDRSDNCWRAPRRSGERLYPRKASPSSPAPS